ncbi:type IV pilus modification protein PilV [Thauera sp. CAU 1555]|uniref:Type IV pilus modification protein PilV n=1 Tax=Thauera sedimentorum TaxID=2767595 RepID=A0ABR9B6C8_9RHOO|nr:type IV pilus modification protein PilV [Thauera sedimentorum]MBD8501469.1 type IV pilus modification protein PilV [Thauera sedimentorum]
MRIQGVSKQRGSTLLEALVAMIILSFGLLGMAGLQGASLQVNQSAMQRSQATMLGHAMLDRIRLAADAGDLTGTPYDIGIDAATPAGADLFSTDIRTWRASLQAALGGAATGGVCRSDADGTCDNAGDYHAIDIRWADAQFTADGGGGSTVQRAAQTLTVVGRL